MTMISVQRNYPAPAQVMEDLIRGQASMQWHEFNTVDFTTAAVAGSGSTGVGTRRMKVSTGTTASSTARRALGSDTMAWSAGKNRILINWSKRVVLSLVIFTDGNSANGEMRVLFGPATSDGVADLATKGIGIHIDNLALKGQTHDGTTLSEVDLSTTLVTVVPDVITITSDGSGNIEWFVNGTSAGTSGSGATGDSSNSKNALVVEVDNNADTTDNVLFLVNAWVGIEQ